MIHAPSRNLLRILLAWPCFVIIVTLEAVRVFQPILMVSGMYPPCRKVLGNRSRASGVESINIALDLSPSPVPLSNAIMN
jgi:hypothetical protein